MSKQEHLVAVFFEKERRTEIFTFPSKKLAVNFTKVCDSLSIPWSIAKNDLKSILKK